MVKTWKSQGKIQCQDMDDTSEKIQSQDVEATKVKSKIKIWRSQVQDHEMNKRKKGKGETLQSPCNSQVNRHCADPLTSRPLG